MLAELCHCPVPRLAAPPPTPLPLLLHAPYTCSVDIPGMFEAKGVKGAAQRLQLLVGDAREPFPAAAKEAGVRGWAEGWRGRVGQGVGYS